METAEETAVDLVAAGFNGWLFGWAKRAFVVPPPDNFDPGAVQHDLKPGDSIVINVENEDINLGTRGHQRDCAIVRALRRQTGWYHWRVANRVALHSGLGLKFRLPDVARDFIACWDDQTAAFGAFSFEATLTPMVRSTQTVEV